MAGKAKRKSAYDLIELAITSIENGALYTGVKLLREAADSVEQVAKECDNAIQQEIIKESIGK